MPPYIRDQLLQLHPYQQMKFMELIGWSNGGTSESCQPSMIAFEKALQWAMQVDIPPPQPEIMPGEE